ncbi:MAG: SDR family NAD(P)-dependent oxidoreductase [Enhygromyxa sp.]
MDSNEKIIKALRASLKETERLRRQNRELTEAAGEPIAIVSVACRLPGGIDDPAGAWQLLVEGRDAIGPIPQDRGWPTTESYSHDRDQPGTYYTEGGGFLSRPDLFDPSAFGITPREAEAIDPQQRVLLELAWEVCERAGIPPLSLEGSDSGVFVGVCYDDYKQVGPSIGESSDGYKALGTSPSVASGRIAYSLGLQGPTVSIDTACSTSLVAIHLACQALRRRECSLAFCGGATIFATLEPLIIFSRLKAISRDGRCRAFSAQADGAGWAEGAGMILIERLSDALEKGHPVLATIVGSAVNQDGRSQGLTAPNGPAQERVIRAALASAKLTPDQVDVVEAHGTGTSLGDPIEVHALQSTYGSARSHERPLLLGTIKSNIGHTQAAAGVIGVIKMVLSLQHQYLPKTLHANELSPHIDWNGGSIKVLQEAATWPRTVSTTRRAAVSSFGISGTNAHVILAESPNAEDPVAESVTATMGGPVPILISAKTDVAVRAQAQRLIERIEADPNLAVPDIAYTLARARSHLVCRACVVASDRDTALDGLTGIATRNPMPHSSEGVANVDGRLTFVFPGQGSQWRGMARRLLDESEMFRARADACARALAPHTDWSLLPVLRDEPGAASLDRVDVVQPVLWAMMVCLADLWRSLGVEPDAVIGHSQGEIAAATVAGALSLEDGAKVVALRSNVIRALSGLGAMAAVSLCAAELGSRIARFGRRLAVAVDNGPDSTVVSGDPDAIDELIAELQEAGVFARKVRVNYASHCAQIERLESELLNSLADIRPQAARIPMVSTVNAALIDTRNLDAQYWYQNLRHTVRFAGAVDTLLDRGHRFFLEISPHPVMSVALGGILSAKAMTGAVTGTLRREEGGLDRIVFSLGELHNRGFRLDWDNFFPPDNRRTVDLPTYAFVRQRHWPDHRAAHSDINAAGLSPVAHPLLRAHTFVATEPLQILTGSLSRSTFTWLEDHRVFNRVLFPGVGVAELVLSGLGSITPAARGVAIDELVLVAPLLLDDEAHHIQIGFGDERADGTRPFSVHSRPTNAQDDLWTEHATGFVRSVATPPTIESPTWPPRDCRVADADALYAALGSAGLHYGPAFRGLRRVWTGEPGEVYAELELPTGITDGGGFAIHPALLDAVLHTAFFGLGVGERDRIEVALPFAFRDLSFHALGAKRLRVRASVTRRGQSASLSFVAWEASSGQLVARLGELDSRPVSLSQLDRAQSQRHLYALVWHPVSLARQVQISPNWDLIGSEDEFVPLLEQLHERGVEARRWASWSAFTDAVADSSHTPGLIIRIADRPEHDELAAGIHEVAQTTVEEIRDWVTHPGLARCQMVLVTRNAIGVGEQEVDLLHAPLLGIARSARNEHPERVLCSLDTDGALDFESLTSALAETSERELVRRRGEWLAPRLVPRTSTSSDSTSSDSTSISNKGTVLITGGTGTLGAQLARHLVTRHRVRHLLLTSRSGPNAAGARRFVDELIELGAETVEIKDCDVADRQVLAATLAAIPASRQLCAVFHVAGVLEDALLINLTPDQFHRVLAPKVDGALNLDALTCRLKLDAFVLFSSVAGVFGSAGQGNYAAANVFVDALAHHRRANDLPALSLAWGLWSEGGMIAHLDNADLNRLSAGGVRPLSVSEGMSLLDTCLAQPDALLVPVKLHLASIRRLPRTPSVMRALVPTGIDHIDHHAGGESDISSLVALPEAEREAALQKLVSAEVRAILRLPDEIDPDRPISELGLDSLMGVELRNQLQRLTGLALPSTVAFDHPSVRALTGALLAGLEFDSAPTPTIVTMDSPEASAPADEGALGPRADSLGRTLTSWYSNASSRVRRPESNMWLVPLLSRSIADGNVKSAMSVLLNFIEMRKHLDEIATPPGPTRLTPPTSADGAGRQLYCVPSLAIPSTSLQFIKLASHLPGLGEVWTTDNLGYEVGSTLPDGQEALIQQHLAAIDRIRTKGEFVLIGYSAGGWLAAQLAHRLERSGRAAQDLVLLDTTRPPADGIDASVLWVQRTIELQRRGIVPYSEAELMHQFSAMIHNISAYTHNTQLFDAPLSTSTLFIKAELGMSFDAADHTYTLHSDPEEFWQPLVEDLTIRTLPQDHFEIISTGAAATAGVLAAHFENRGG